jgi:TolB protein
MLHRARGIPLVTIVLVGLLIVAATPTAATFPGPNGRITFMRSDSDGRFQLWVADPDLSDQRQLTRGPVDDAWFPSWSPDGTRIAFSSSRTDPDPTDDREIHDVFTMRTDGTDVRRITDSNGYSGKPSWSPEGRWLVFDADRGDYPTRQGIYVVAADGSAPARRVTRLPGTSAWQELARFSPDGKSLVFDEARTIETEDGPVDQTALFTVRLDGSKLRRVTPWEISAADADWSPDGRRLVFAARLAEADFVQSVMTIDPDGRGLRLLTPGDQARGEGDAFRYQESFNPAWSPDGRSIIFVRATYTEAQGFAMGLQTMKPNGSRRTALSFGEEHQPDWGSVPPIP